MVTRRIDQEKSRVRIRTRAKGLLSKLAHDLEITAKGIEGKVNLEDDALSGRLQFPVHKLEVVGSLKRGEVDRKVLSKEDREEIERRIREEVLPIEAVVVELSGSRDQVEAEVQAAEASQHLTVPLESRDDGGAAVGEGKTELSLRELGIREIKGPLGAFKLDDAVEVGFRINLRPVEPPD